MAFGDNTFVPIGDSFGAGRSGQFIQMNGRCPVCNHAFDFRRLHVLSEQNGATLLHITCQNCKSATLAQVAVSQAGVNFSGIVTDLTITDVLKFKGQEAITANDVMHFHDDLHANNFAW